ncbi:radical SAM protein [Acetobacterium paludosum]|uniref:Radical SAM protein n=1 Tax=Acetobacterium paludosum TaxID=52693 RepID=A0A923I2J3_9FIRM|nr:radical SAM protein [Acetobacterium paludosum]MBC3888823.1 radical SAM protein [Acetobacterium paludosum]
MDFISATIKEKPKVLLIYTQRMVRGRTFEMIENLGILTLAAQLNAHGFDANAYTGITTDTVKTIEKMKDNLFAVCFYCDFDNQSAVASMIKYLKSRYDFYVVLGGPHTRHMTATDLDVYQADAIIKGEGEETLIEWLTGKITGSETAVPGEIRTGENADYVQINDFSTYQLPCHEDVLDYRERPLLSVITARGCPYRCAFCFEGGNSKKLRMRPVEDVLEEIEQRLSNSHRPRYLFFTDDTLTTDPDRLKLLLAGLRELRKKHDFVWFCEGHPGFLVKHPGLIREMIDSGMVRMQIGMESGVEEVLKAYGKQAKPEDIKKVVEICYEEGLPQLTGNYIIGGALETEETLRETTKAVLKLLSLAPGLLDLSTTFIMPLPGTKIYNHPEDFQIVLEDRDYITSFEDFPVNHTWGLSLPEVCMGRSRFITKISQRMKEQFEKGLIPKERIKQDFQLALKYGIAGGYFKYIYAKNIVMFRYYSKLIEYDGLLKEWYELSKAEKDNWIIQKIPAFSMLDIKAMNQIELDMLKYAGRLSVKELSDKLKLSSENMNKLLTKMSDHYLILFSEFI